MMPKFRMDFTLIYRIKFICTNEVSFYKIQCIIIW